jgi:hypothetical protein
VGGTDNTGSGYWGEGGVSVMDNLWTDIVSGTMARVSGPMKLRLVLQPAMAICLAIHGGLRDASAGKPPYFWSLLSDRGHRAEIVEDGWKSVGKVFVLATALDVIYQFVVSRSINPGDAIIVAFVLSIVPYLIVRGFATRLTRHTRTTCRTAPP